MEIWTVSLPLFLYLSCCSFPILFPLPFLFHHSSLYYHFFFPCSPWMPQPHLEFQPVNMIDVLLDQLMYGWEMGEMQGGVRIRLAHHDPLSRGDCPTLLRFLTDQVKQEARSRTLWLASVFPRREEIGTLGEEHLARALRLGRNCILVFTALSALQESFGEFWKGNSYDIDFLIEGTEFLLSSPSIFWVLLAWRWMRSHLWASKQRHNRP